MRISGLEKCSLVDYPGKLAAVVFLGGCNLNCTYCHNRDLLKKDNSLRELSTESVLSFLRARKGLLDAVVVTGGEPTLNIGLPSFIRCVRKLGFLVKLDTNGTNPEMVRNLVNEGLLDYVAMDIKTTLPNYSSLCRSLVDTGAIVRTINLLMDSPVDYEFRTTIYPGLAEHDLRTLAELLTGAEKWVLQHYSPQGNLHLDCLDPNEIVEKPDLVELASEFSASMGECTVRGKEMPLKLKKWHPDPADSGHTTSPALDVPRLLS